MASLQPTFTPRKPQWRGNTSSKDLNLNFEEILYDLNTIFEEAASIVVDLNELESKMRHEAEALEARLYAVSGLITAYDQSSTSYKMLHEDFYIADKIDYPENLAIEDKCVVDTNFGVVTLPVNNSFSKVYTINIADGEAYRAPDLYVKVIPVDEIDNVGIEETDPLRVFDGNDGTVWERKVRFNRDSTQSSVECKMEVTLPSMSNPYVNKVYIKPYPEGIVDVTQFTYDTLTSQDNIIPTFPAVGENAVRSQMYSFNKIQPSKLKIYFRQRNGKLEDDYKTFVYGAKEIGVENVEYRASGKVGIRFDLPDYETGLFYHITSLRSDPEYDNITYKLSLYASDSDFNTDSPIWTSSNSSITTLNQLDVSSYATSSIWVLVELIQTENSSDSPLFNSLTMTYTTII